MADPIVFPGTVEWSGENPGISLKDQPDGPFVALASFFRVVLTAWSRPCVGAPSSARERQSASGSGELLPARQRGSRPLSRRGVRIEFRRVPRPVALSEPELPAQSRRASGDQGAPTTETVSADDLDVQLT